MAAKVERPGAKAATEKAAADNRLEAGMRDIVKNQVKARAGDMHSGTTKLTPARVVELKFFGDLLGLPIADMTNEPLKLYMRLLAEELTSKGVVVRYPLFTEGD